MTDGGKIPVQHIPLQRMGEPSEVAELATFLIKATYITGQVTWSYDFTSVKGNGINLGTLQTN